MKFYTQLTFNCLGVISAPEQTKGEPKGIYSNRCHAFHMTSLMAGITALFLTWLSMAKGIKGLFTPWGNPPRAVLPRSLSVWRKTLLIGLREPLSQVSQNRHKGHTGCEQWFHSTSCLIHCLQSWGFFPLDAAADQGWSFLLPKKDYHTHPVQLLNYGQPTLPHG